MPNLPQNFSPTENLQDIVMRTVNREVYEWFRDAEDNDLSTPRGLLKVMCTHRDGDTIGETTLKTLFFYLVCGAQPGMKAWLAPEREILSMEGHPQVILAFSETERSMKSRKMKKRHAMRCSFRLLSEKFESFSDKGKLETLGRKIKSQFPDGFRYQTGQTTYSYIDKARGYQLRVPAFQEGDARSLVRKLLECSLTNVPFDEDNFSRASTKRRPAVRTKMVLGKATKLNERRPTAVMALRQADLFIPGHGSELLVYRGLK